MPQRCSLCIHEQRREIDTALVTGTSYRNVAERFGTSLAALNRHKAHVAQAIVTVQERRETESGENSFDAMRRVQRKAWELLAKCEKEGDSRAAIVALREVRECIGALGKMLAAAGESEGLTVQIVSVGAPETCPHCGKPLEPTETLQTEYNVGHSYR